MNINVKIGDHVRFLNESGGGVVAGFQGKNIVLVEDEDGFQVPMAINEVVVIGNENYDTRHIVEVKQQQKKETAEPEPADRPVTFKAAPEERKGGEQLSAYLAFVPMDVKELTTTRFETYFVNDSNYYLRFTYMTAQGAGWQLIYTTEVEPNTQVFIEEFGREDLNQMDRVTIQMLPYKRGKSFLLKPSVDVQLRIDPVKFYKLHTFQPNNFFEQPALLYTLIENDKPARPLVIDAKQLKEHMYGEANNSGKPAATSYLRLQDDGTVVVDLHASELLDTTTGLSASDILNHQLDVFRKTLKEYEKKKGTRIVFIHGKGEGILRKALLNELQYRYKSFTYQDASFREYGYGATQVTIK